MSVEWWSWGFKHGPPYSRDRYVWLALANHADKVGACFPSIDLLIEETRLKRSSVQRAMKALVADGWVIRTERGNGRGKRTHYQLVKRVSDSDPLANESVTLKGSPADSHAESQGPEKGVTLTKPPYPLIGVTVNEPSKGTGEGDRHARGTRSPSPPQDSEEWQAAFQLFWNLNVPADDKLHDLAAQAIHFEAERLGSIEAAKASIFKAAQAAQKSGAVKSWQFWLEDCQYRQSFFCPRV